MTGNTFRRKELRPWGVALVSRGEMVWRRPVRVEGIVRIFLVPAAAQTRLRLQERSNRNVRRTQQLMADLYPLVDQANLSQERRPESDFPQIARFR